MQGGRRGMEGRGSIGRAGWWKGPEWRMAGREEGKEGRSYAGLRKGGKEGGRERGKA